jgi:O-antigen ligase
MTDRRIFNLALKVFLFLSPLFFFKELHLSFARGLFFILGSFILFGISLSLDPRRKFANIWLSLFILLAVVRVFFDNGISNSAGEWFNFWLSCANFIYVFCGVLLFYTVYCYADKPGDYFKPIMWVSILNFLLLSTQLMNKDFMWHNAPSFSGFMENSSQLGQYSALALPITFFLNPIFSIIPLVTLVVSNSVSPMLASVAGMALIGGFKGRILTIKIAVGVLLTLAFVFNFSYVTAKFQCRPIMWQTTLKLALQRPFLGWGYGSFRKEVTGNSVLAALGTTEFSRAHNDFLHTAQELGFPIMVCVGMFFYGIFKKFIAIKNKDKILLTLSASVIIVLVNMSGQTLIRYASIAGTFIVLLALFCVKLEEAQNSGSVS